VSVSDLLRLVAARLEMHGIPFMLTGSVAAAFHGAGRATMDVDLVIDATRDQLRALVASLAAPDLYVSSEAAMEALDRESMFNVVDAITGWKADLIIRKSRPFSLEEFARRRAFEFEGTTLWVSPQCCESSPARWIVRMSIDGSPSSALLRSGRPFKKR
jgi:hypothetical protein